MNKTARRILKAYKARKYYNTVTGPFLDTLTTIDEQTYAGTKTVTYRG